VNQFFLGFSWSQKGRLPWYFESPNPKVGSMINGSPGHVRKVCISSERLIPNHRIRTDRKERERAGFLSLLYRK
jgi:hypothetical protein